MKNGSLSSRGSNASDKPTITAKALLSLLATRIL
jgi:hypothetical protein